MTALSDLTSEVLNRLSNFGIVQGRTAWLRAGVDASDLTWLIDTDSVGEGVAEVDDELVYFRSYDSTSQAVTVAPDGRGWDGTTAAPHATNARIRMEPVFPKRNIQRAIDATMRRMYPMVFATETVTVTVDGVTATHELPEDAEGVIAVRVQDLGPSGVWFPLNEFSFDGHADTTEYPTGRTITFTGVYPGRDVQVVVKKRPTPVTSAMTLFTETGLQESARYAVILGTCADLMRFSDPSRLVFHSASADEFDSKRGYGLATKIANDLEAQFQRELSGEVSRLRQLFPPSIRRKRV